MRRIVPAIQQPSDAYLITEARWPRNNQFDADRAAFYAKERMRAEFRHRYTHSSPISPYVTLTDLA